MQPNYQPQYPAAPQQPAYPMQPGYPAQQYPQQPAMPQYPQAPAYPQQYTQPQYAPPAPPAAPLPAVSLDDFYQQPSSSSGPSLKFKDANDQPLIGKFYEGFIARAITDGDVRPQVNRQGVVQTYRDGRVKSVMVVPLLMQPTEEFRDGQAGWWVKGQARDELARAMAEAGAPAGAPEAGAWVRVTLVGVRPIPNMSPAFQYRVDYVRPQGAQQAAAAPAPQVPVAQVAPVAQQPVQVPQMVGVPAVAPQAPVAQPMAMAPQVPAQPAAPVAQAAPVAAPAAMPAGLSPEQQALMAKLSGQPAAA